MILKTGLVYAEQGNKTGELYPTRCQEFQTSHRSHSGLEEVKLHPLKPTTADTLQHIL